MTPTVGDRLRAIGRAGSWRRLTSGSVLALVVPFLVVVAGLGGAVTGNRVTLLNGAAWLPSTVGQVMLVSGASARPAATVAVGTPGDDLSVVQSGTTAYVVNRSAGTVTRVDGATFDTTDAVQFSADGGDSLQVLTGGGTVVVLDGANGLVYDIDPITLASRGTPKALDVEVAPGAAVVDATGRLWVVDASGGGIRWLSADGSPQSASSGLRPAHLTLAGGQPVAVGDTGADWLSDDGSSDAHVDFGLRPSEVAVVSGTPDGRLLVVVGSRTVELCDRAGCAAKAFPLVNAGARLGAAILMRGVILVPDLDKGTVHLISETDGRRIASPQILDPTADFDLFDYDTFAFYNDRNSERAGILQLEGTFSPVQKYAPGDPNAGLDVAAQSQVAPVITTPPPSSADLTPPGLETATGSTSAPNNTQTTPPPGVSADATTRPPSVRTSNTPTNSPSTTLPQPTSTTQPPERQRPVLGQITISGSFPGPFQAGDTLTFNAPVLSGDATTWKWGFTYSNGSPYASSDQQSPVIEADSGGSSYEDYRVTVVASNAQGSSEPVTSQFQVIFSGGTAVTALNVSPNPAEVGSAIHISPTIEGEYSSCRWTIGGTEVACTDPITAPGPGNYPVAINVVPRSFLRASTPQETLTVTAPPVPTSSLIIGIGGDGSGSVSAVAAGVPNLSCDSGSACLAEGYPVGGLITITASSALSRIDWTGCDQASGSVCTVSMSAEGRTVAVTFTAPPANQPPTIDSVCWGTLEGKTGLWVVAHDDNDPPSSLVVSSTSAFNGRRDFEWNARVLEWYSSFIDANSFNIKVVDSADLGTNQTVFVPVALQQCAPMA